MTKLTKKNVLEELNKSSNSQIIFKNEIKAIIYTPGEKCKFTTLEKDVKYWLKGNIIKFPLGSWDKENKFKNSIPEEWRNDLLIPLHNNCGGYTSGMISKEPFKSIPGLYFVKLNDLIKNGVFSVINKTFKYAEILKAAIQIEAEIVDSIYKDITNCFKNGEFDTDTYFDAHEDMWYMIMEDELMGKTKIDLGKIDMSDNTFNEVQTLGLSLLRKAFNKHKVSKEVIAAIIGDSGVTMINF